MAMFHKVENNEKQAPAAMDLNVVVEKTGKVLVGSKSKETLQILEKKRKRKLVKYIKL